MSRLRKTTIALGLLAIVQTFACGGTQRGTDQSLVEKVCVHAMAVARREQIGDFTMEECRSELQKRGDKLGGGFDGWAHCLLEMDSIEEAKLTCRESDFMQPS